MEWREMLDTAEAVAREAGGILREGASHLRVVEYQDQRDVKLRADMESEELIRKRSEDHTVDTPREQHAKVCVVLCLQLVRANVPVSVLEDAICDPTFNCCIQRGEQTVGCT